MKKQLSAISVKEASERLKLSIAEIERMIAQNKLHGYSESGKMFVYLYSVEDYEKSNHGG